MTQIYLDSADPRTILAWARDPLISGFTTNPTLLKKAGITDYAGFAKELLAEVKGKPVSFEILDPRPAMIEQQARIIAGWGENAVVKIPIMGTSKSNFPYAWIERLSHMGVTINVTALMVLRHILACNNCFGKMPGYVSVFAGRIADTGKDPMPIMENALKVLHRDVKMIWASPREVFNFYQAEAIGCHIITMTPDLVRKMFDLRGKSLLEYSWETVKQFTLDGREAGLTL